MKADIDFKKCRFEEPPDADSEGDATWRSWPVTITKTTDRLNEFWKHDTHCLCTCCQCYKYVGEVTAIRGVGVSRSGLSATVELWKEKARFEIVVCACKDRKGIIGKVRFKHSRDVSAGHSEVRFYLNGALVAKRKYRTLPPIYIIL